MLRSTDFIKSQIALAAWREAHHLGGYHAQVQIAQCIMNRIKNGWGTALEVIEKIPLFAAWSTPPAGYPDVREPGFQRLLEEIDKVYGGDSLDLVHEACFWADLSQPIREWFKTRVIDHPEAHARLANNTTLYFFK